MGEIRLKWLDVVAAALWVLAVIMLAVESTDGRDGLWADWSMLAIAGAGVSTLIDWASRRLVQLDLLELARLEAIHQGITVLNGGGGERL